MNANSVTADKHGWLAQSSGFSGVPLYLHGLLTYADAAEFLKTTTRHVERLVSRRQLKAVALGQGDKLPRIRPTDLLAFIDSMEPIARADDPTDGGETREVRS